MSTKHTIAAARFLKNKENEAWHDHTLWMVRTKRDKMSHSLPEWERLRELASEIKLYSNSHLDTLLEEFEKNAIANGAIVHWAKDAEEHNEIVLRILRQHEARNLIKSKSMLTEECHMNEFLMSKGIDVVESDLGERILQLMHLAPSHIVMPAIHIKREQISEMMEREMGTEKGNIDPTYLTHAARKNLREKFLHADVAMTGVNFAVASTGEIVVCTNEGNADMGTSFPKVHIATMGMEKIVPNLEALGVFTRLLARSGTGQPVTSYTSHYRRPPEGQEFHIIIVDNGRSDILAKPDHIRTLNCIRCGECMNTCPVYRRSGGYSYTYFIPGPIGINLGMLRNPEEYSDNVSACSLCLSCSNVCPVKIDLGEQIYRWRQDLDKIGKASKEKKVMSFGMKFLMERPGLFNTALKFAPVVNHLPRFMVYNGLNAWGKGRELPAFAKESFNDMWKKNKVR
ncbi:lactate utilization protein B [uncultured Parabacteroides sp.]|uniref:lactate utilization protein B n=1 Tax=uncultured Parabacteroides sp. TaxID=512312 RepID=UPI00260F6876|nr:lactate utilization protein B [uncultured Parabacteroides sp.]